jgi:hypothetical protein
MELDAEQSQNPRFFTDCTFCSSFVRIERRGFFRHAVNPRRRSMPRLVKLLLSLVVVGNFAVTGPAIAEEPVVNPLRPKAGESRRAREPAAKPEEKPAEAAKPKRERSAKQKENDEMMKACGAEWRAEKVSLQAKGETWRSFLKDCRAKKRSQTPV